MLRTDFRVSLSIRPSSSARRTDLRGVSAFLSSSSDLKAGPIVPNSLSSLPQCDITFAFAYSETTRTPQALNNHGSQDGRGGAKQRWLRLPTSGSSRSEAEAEADAAAPTVTTVTTVTAQGAGEDGAVPGPQREAQGSTSEQGERRGSFLPEEDRENRTESSRKSRGSGCAFPAKKTKKKSDHNS